jgi:DNA-binding transcriptional MerR regulator
LSSAPRTRRIAAQAGFPTFLTTAEVAAILRRPESTLRYWRRQGEGPKGLLVGGTYLYPEGNVRAWLKSIDTLGALA